MSSVRKKDRWLGLHIFNPSLDAYHWTSLPHPFVDRIQLGIHRLFTDRISEFWIEEVEKKNTETVYTLSGPKNNESLKISFDSSEIQPIPWKPIEIETKTYKWLQHWMDQESYTTQVDQELVRMVPDNPHIYEWTFVDKPQEAIQMIYKGVGYVLIQTTKTIYGPYRNDETLKMSLDYM